MNRNAWQRPLLSTLALGVTLAVAQMSHAATEWKPGVPRTAYVTLFEWSWDSVARECTNFLGPKGYAAVQVSPPQEHGPGGEWWRRYQPVSYKLESRSGNRAQFENMVKTCKAAGVDVYVDTVINHMADYHGGTGTGGSSWGGRYFPGVPFGSEHFHSPKCDIAQGDYNSNRNNVVRCDLPGLPDLDTGNSYVQDKIAAYMKDMLSLGVAGFRIDAAKHIAPSELAAIKARVPGSYFFTQEVIRDGSVGSATSGDLKAYQDIGTVNEFNFIYAMKNSMLNLYNSNLAKIPEIFSSWGFIPSAKATVFVNNHDTERKECSSYAYGSGVCDSLSTLNGNKLYLANILMLAWDYGYPTVASGYYFNDHDGGPPGQPYNGSESSPSNCSSSYQMGKWDCVHRDRRVVNMVGFRNYVNGTAVANWVVGDNNQAAFSRGSKGFVAINNSGNTWQKTFTTGLADGKYCNVLAVDNPESGSCAGNEVTVNGGQATLSINPGSAVAIHIGAKVGGGGDKIAPSVPGSPTAGSITTSGATISWNASTDNVGVTGYRVTVTQNGAVVSTRDTSSTSVTLTGLNPNTAYVAKIIASDAAGNVSSAAQVPFTTKTASTSATVYYYTGWTTAYGYINSTLTPFPGLKMSNACTGWKVRTENLRGYSSIKVRFNNGTTWDSRTYTVTAGINVIKNGVVSKGSNPCASADSEAPTVPGSLASSAVTSSSVGLRWTASSDNVAVTGYHVYRDNVLVGNTTEPEYTDNSVVAGTRYEYTVLAYDAAGNKSIKTPVLPVTVPGSQTQDVTISFTVSATTSMGENVYITGNQAALGNWSTTEDAGRKCSPASYPVWTCTVTFPAGTTAIAYKYQIIGNGNVKWESGADRTWTVPASNSTKDDGSFRQ